MSASAILRAEDLGRRVGGAWIWRSLSVDLCAGDRAVLVGPSGTGKSLLLRTLCALDHPDEGELSFRGHTIESRDVPSFRAHVIYVQQQPVLVPGTVRDNLLLPAEFKTHARRPLSLERASELFAQLGKPPDFIDRRSSVLSGGEGQLLGLVRALILEPDVLLLDEPTAHLDLDTTALVERIVLAWAAAGERALLWTSHDPVQVDRVRSGVRIDLGAGP